MTATRSIAVSTDVYAAIWRAQRSGEENEEDILRRILGVPTKQQPQPPTAPAKIGFRDPRFGIELPEGFEIFRIYRGVEYRAKATNGGWMLMSTGKIYPSLNQLSRAIGTKVENAWQNWYYTAGDGKRQLVSALRK